MSFLFKRIPSFSRKPQAAAAAPPPLPSSESDDPNEQFYTAPNRFLEKCHESIGERVMKEGPCTAQQCLCAGEYCFTSSSSSVDEEDEEEEEDEEGEVSVLEEPSSSIFYVSSIPAVTSFSTCSGSSDEDITSVTSHFGESQVGGTNAANLRKQNITLQEQNNALKLKNDILMDMVVGLKADLAARDKELEMISN